MSKTEMSVARNVVRLALARDYLVSVYDGEDYPVRKSAKFTEITNALCSTDSDLLIIRRKDGSRVGVILFVWGNSADELVADYTDKEEIEALIPK